MALDDLQLLQPLLTRTLGHRPSPATIWRWHNKGVKVGERRIRLRAIKVGGKLYGTPEDVQRFIAEQNEPDEHVEDAGDRPAATQRRLEEAGLL